jgi:hypothetical protein
MSENGFFNEWDELEFMEMMDFDDDMNMNGIPDHLDDNDRF